MRGAIHLPRRLFHMAATSVLALLGLLLEKEPLLVLLLAGSATVVAGDVARLLVPVLNRLFVRLLAPLLRETEEHRITGVSYGLLGILAVFGLFERDVAVLAVLFLALGDPVAAMVGVQFRRGRVFGKSPWGSMAMIATALGTVAVLHGMGAIGFQWAFVAGALAAAVFELIPVRLNDNFVVPVGAGAVMTALGA